MLAASTVQQSVALVIAGIILVGAILWLLGNVRKAKPEVGAEIELAANRKPLPTDEEMEGPRLDGVLRWALVSLAIVAVGLPLYWLAEPGRQSGAIENFESTFEHRGEALFATTEEGGFNCAGCHGGVSGGAPPYTMTDPETGKLRQVLWKAPSLDDVYLRMSEDQLREVLVYGRPYSPMPAWGLEGGGPMNEQQIDNLIAYLRSVAITPKEAKERSTKNAADELKRLRDPQAALAAAEDALAAATDEQSKIAAQMQINEVNALIESGQEASPGAALFNVTCARCHTLGWSFFEPQAPGGGAFGPSLANVENQFPDVEDHKEFVAEGKAFGEKYGRQGKASGRMPYFNQLLTKEQIDQIVEYERTLSRQEEQ